MHRLLLTFPLPTTLPRVRFIRSCSSPLSEQLFTQLEERFMAPVLEAYAMTEASHQMTSNPLPPASRHAGTVGIPQGVEVRLLEHDSDAEVATGEEGEISIRGANITKGYLHNTDANRKAFTSCSFFRTGDQGKFDKHGYLTLTGRIKEFINKGGEKISPAELDNVALQHPSVAEAVSFAVDDEDYGQEVGMAIKVKKGEKLDGPALKKFLAEKLATHKLPKKVRLRPFIFVWREDYKK
jgi:oxalate---CoA ligase